MMDAQQHTHLRELIEGFDTAMLVTQRGGAMRSRPMHIAQVEDDGTLWFASAHDGKIDDIDMQPDVCVVMQSRTHFVSVSGRAVAVHDRLKLDELWKDSWKAWFPKGRYDPTLILIRVAAARAEFWDMSTANLVAHVWEAAKAFVTGELIAPFEAEHGVVDNPRRAAAGM